MIRVIRSSAPLPKTRTVIRAGDIIVPWTMPDEREQRRRHRHESSTSVYIEAMDGDA